VVDVLSTISVKSRAALRTIEDYLASVNSGVLHGVTAMLCHYLDKRRMKPQRTKRLLVVWTNVLPVSVSRIDEFADKRRLGKKRLNQFRAFSREFRSDIR